MGRRGRGSDTCHQLKLVKPSNFVKNKANDTQVNLRTQITIEKNWEEMIKILFLIVSPLRSKYSLHNHASVACFSSCLTLSFFNRPIKFFFSWSCWNRPCPNLEEVSMNFKVIFSRAFLLVCANND